MTETLRDAFARAWKILEGAQRIALIYDGDADGLTAGTITRHALDQAMPGKVVLENTSASRDFITADIVTEAQRLGVDCFLTLDFDPSNYDQLGLIDQGYKSPTDADTAASPHIVVIDHHPCQGKARDDIIRVNPHLQAKDIGSRYNTSKLCFDLLRDCSNADIERYDFLAATGIIGDYCMETWEDFLKKTVEKYGAVFSPNTITDWFRSPLSILLTPIDCARALSDTQVKKMREVLGTLENYQDARIVENPFPQVQREVEQTIRTYKEHAIIDEKLMIIWLTLDTDYKIGSWITSIISNDRPEMLYLTLRHGDTFVSVNARCQSQRVDCGAIMQAATRDLKDANGGGHPPAAGGRIRADDLDTFKKNVIKVLTDGR